jgi:hypothetical protein
MLSVPAPVVVYFTVWLAIGVIMMSGLLQIAYFITHYRYRLHMANPD